MSPGVNLSHAYDVIDIFLHNPFEVGFVRIRKGLENSLLRGTIPLQFIIYIRDIVIDVHPIVIYGLFR